MGNPCLGFRFKLMEALFLPVSCRFKDRQTLFLVAVASPRSFHGPWRLQMAGLTDQSSFLVAPSCWPCSLLDLTVFMG